MRFRNLLRGAGLLLCMVASLRGEEGETQYTINFLDVPVVEFIQFVKRISGVNFVFNHQELQFNITMASGHPASSAQVVKALIQILKAQGMSISEEDGYLVIHKRDNSAHSISPEPEILSHKRPSSSDQLVSSAPFSTPRLLPSIADISPWKADHYVSPRFLVYKLKYHQGDEIEDTLRKIGADLATKPETAPKYLDVLRSVQWVKATNSLVYSGEGEPLDGVRELIESLDTPLSQVFIEVLVVETDVRNTSELGLQWAAGGKYKNSLGGGMGNFSPGYPTSPFALTFQEVDAANPPTGSKQIPLGNGFDMGVIGDLIFHKGCSYLSLGSLVSALQTDGNSTIILNQKIITQDNKPATLFVGDNMPFTGSVVSTIGTGQQTTANIDYKDVGVKLSLTTQLGDGDIVSMDIDQEITEAVPSKTHVFSPNFVSGIQTTKTNMVTHVHVPDQHFLVLSGVIRNAKRHHKAGLPCLGALPFLGAAFSKADTLDERRNVVIFVRPTIIHSHEEYKRLTEKQEELYRSSSIGERALKEAVALIE